MSQETEMEITLELKLKISTRLEPAIDDQFIAELQANVVEALFAVNEDTGLLPDEFVGLHQTSLQDISVSHIKELV